VVNEHAPAVLLARGLPLAVSWKKDVKEGDGLRETISVIVHECWYMVFTQSVLKLWHVGQLRISDRIICTEVYYGYDS